MVSHYFYIEKAGPIRQLCRALVEETLQGNTRMVRAYNPHGLEAGRVVQITCDVEVEPEFLRLMRMARICIIGSDVDPLALLQDIPAVGRARDSLTEAHLKTIGAQWKRCAEAAKYEETRTHLTNHLPLVRTII